MLKYSTASFAIAKEIHKRPITLADMGGLQSGDVSAIPALVWLGLLADDNNAEYMDVIKWIASCNDEGSVIETTIRAVEQFGRQMDRLKPAGDEGNAK